MKKTIWTVWGSVVMLSVSTLLGACGPATDAPAETKQTPKAAQTTNKPAQKTVSEKANKADKEKKVVKKAVAKEQKPAARRDILKNGNFKEWEGAQLKGWTFRPATRISKVEQTPGNVDIMLKPDAKEDTIMIVPVSQAIAGKTLTVTVKGKSGDPGLLGFRFEGMAGGKEFESKYTHPGNNEWVNMSRTFIVPKEFEKGSGKLRIFLRDGAKSPAYIENASIYVK